MKASIIRIWVAVSATGTTAVNMAYIMIMEILSSLSRVSQCQ